MRVKDLQAKGINQYHFLTILENDEIGEAAPLVPESHFRPRVSGSLALMARAHTRPEDLSVHAEREAASLPLRVPSTKRKFASFYSRIVCYLRTEQQGEPMMNKQRYMTIAWRVQRLDDS